MLLERELKALDCKMSTQAFQDLIVKAYKESFHQLPDEQMVRDLDRARGFCDLIRARSHSPSLTDVIIIGTVQNLRKRSKLKKAYVKRKGSERPSIHSALQMSKITKPKGGSYATTSTSVSPG